MHSECMYLSADKTMFGLLSEGFGLPGVSVIAVARL